MKLDAKKLASAAMLTWAGWYSICAFFVAVAPEETRSVFSYVFHYQLNGSLPITLGMYFFGVLGTSAWVGLFVATLGWCYNALRRDRTVEVFPHRSAVSAG